MEISSNVEIVPMSYPTDRIDSTNNGGVYLIEHVEARKDSKVIREPSRTHPEEMDAKKDTKHLERSRTVMRWKM